MTSKSTSRSVVPLLGRSARPQLSMMKRQRSEQRNNISTVVSRPTRITAESIINNTTNNNTGANNVDNHFLFQPKELRRVPVFYPIAKTSRTINGLTGTEVASRIMNCLRSLSVHAKYDNKNSRASLATIEGVRMQLSLYDVSSGADGGHKILLELQRWSGDSVIFHRYSRDILNSADAADTDAALEEIDCLNIVDQMTISADNHANKKRKLNNEQPLSMTNTTTTSSALEREEEEYENTILAMESAHTLLMKDRIDAKQLGLESLLFMTDSNKNTNSATAKIIASQVVLFGKTTSYGQEKWEHRDMESTTTIFQEIHETILSLLNPAEADDNEEGRFHNLALSIFANALNVVRTTESRADRDHIEIYKMGYYESLVSSLLGELSRTTQTTTTSPHTTYLLIRCLRLLLCTLSDNADTANIKQQIFVKLGGNRSVNRAMDIGVNTHQKLELECRKFLKQVSFKCSN